jgi:hypothetical protein
MNLNSRLFDRIRVKPREEPIVAATSPPCAHAGCQERGDYRAPMGRNHEGMFFCFCIDHVREYNAGYNYFDGMSDADVAKYQREAIVGHRPTWAMGVNRAAKGHREEGMNPGGTHDPFNMFGGRAAAPEQEKPRRSHGALRALRTLDLDEMADQTTIRAKYKELVKLFHPDANGGDRSSEDRLREIIRAYKELKTAGLA